jgi:hypothetical protein
MAGVLPLYFLLSAGFWVHIWEKAGGDFSLGAIQP